jgi:glycosyltransferase involved in cell wall biosynthesis
VAAEALEVTPAPAISVVVLSYNARTRIDLPLSSLRTQTLQEPYEVIVVDSGEDDCAAYVAGAYPEARVVRSERRLSAGAGRNRGAAEARAPHVAYLADDCRVAPDWLELRLAKHREGFEAVGGAVTNGTPFHPLGSAGYYLEYTAVMPSARILAEQPIPHALSYSRALIERLGGFAEDTVTGEDTLFNERCVAEGVPIATDPRIRLAHRNITGFRAYLRHQHAHGRGLIQCRRHAGHHPGSATLLGELRWAFARYPRVRWWNALRRVARGRRRALPAYLAVSPLIWAGLWAAGAGCWAEARSERRALHWAGAPPAPDAAD